MATSQNIGKRKIIFPTKNGGGGATNIIAGSTPINGGAPNNLVTTNASGQIITPLELKFDEATGMFMVFDTSTFPAAFVFYLDVNNKTVAFGDLDGIQNSTFFQVSDLLSLIAVNAKRIFLNSTLQYAVTPAIYGSTVTFDLISQTSHFAFQGSGTGSSLCNVINNDFQEGAPLTISDVDNKSALNNITIDVGPGNSITSPLGISQTYDLSINGSSVTIQKVSATKWMLI